jgi:hypothetical protein
MTTRISLPVVRTYNDHMTTRISLPVDIPVMSGE